MLQRQWTRDVNGILNSVKRTNGPLEIVCSISSQRRSLHCSPCSSEREPGPGFSKPSSQSTTGPVELVREPASSEANRVQHLSRFRIGRKTTAWHHDELDNTGMDRITLHSPNLSTRAVFIKHCAKVLKNKRYYKMEHLNLWTFTFPTCLRKAPTTNLRKEKQNYTHCIIILCALYYYTEVTGVCVCVCENVFE